MNEDQGTGSRAAQRGWLIGHAPNPAAAGHTDAGLGAAEGRGIAVDDIQYGGMAAPGGVSYVSTLGFPVRNVWYHLVATFENGVLCPVVLDGGGSEHGGISGGRTDFRMVDSVNGDPEIAFGGLRNYAGTQVNADLAMVRMYQRSFTVEEAAVRYAASCRIYKGELCLDMG